jgi:cytoskeletal protein CcmA (bactofilin family)
MFGKAADHSAGGHSVIQAGVVISGELTAESDLRLDGMLDGSLNCKGRLIIGATGTVHADIEGVEVIVMGTVIGMITGHERVELRNGAHVEGDLRSPSLVIENGVFFQGLSQMTPIDTSQRPGNVLARSSGPPERVETLGG